MVLPHPTPPPFEYRFVFKALLQKRDAVGEHLIDISRRGMYYHSCILVNSQLFRSDYICGLIVLLLIVFLSFTLFGCRFHCPSAFPLKYCENEICYRNVVNLERTLVKREQFRQEKKNG